MLFEIYMIIITAFALFGIFCLAEQIIMAVKYSHTPKTITVLKYDADAAMYNTIGYLHNTLYNNDIIVLSDSHSNECPLALTLTIDELSQYITNALFTKTDN